MICADVSPNYDRSKWDMAPHNIKLTSCVYLNYSLFSVNHIYIYVDTGWADMSLA